MSYKYNPFTGNLDLIRSPGAGDGDVVGPSSSTDESIARFDGTTGKLLQNGANALLNDSGNMKLAGYLGLGSVSNPANTTAGDLTTTRLMLGNNPVAMGASGRALRVDNKDSTTSGVVSASSFINSIEPTATTTAIYRGLTLSSKTINTSTVAVGTMVGGYFETRNERTDQNITTAIGADFIGHIPGVNSWVGAVTSAIGGRFQGNLSGSTSTGTITTAYGIQVINSTLGAGPLVITTQIGIDIATLTVGVTDIGIRIAKADTYSLQLSDTGGTSAGGITFGTDTNLYRSAANMLKTDDSLTVSGVILVPDGSNSAPSYSFSSETAMGIYRASSNVLHIQSAAQINFTNNSGTVMHRLQTNNTSYFGDGTGAVKRIGFGGQTSPSAKIHIAAGEATASGAPFKLTSGTNLTTPEAGAVEYDGTSLFFSPSTTRRTVLLDTFTEALNITLGTTTGTKIGTATNQKIGFFNAIPVVQAAHIANPTAGVLIDAEARTAINAILVVLENLGLTATS